MDAAQFSNYPVSSPEELDELISRNKLNGWVDLDPRHRAFAHSYLESYNKIKAAKEVGLPKSHGMRLLRDPLVASYISTLQDQSKLSSIISRDYINMNYIKLLGYAMGEEEMPIVLGNGEEIVAKKVMVGEAKNILSEMAKSIEYEKDTGSKVAPVSININFGNLLGDDLPIIEGQLVE